MVSQPAQISLPGETQRWQSMVEAISEKRREMKPRADQMDAAIRSVILNVQAVLALAGSIYPANADEVCEPTFGLPTSYVDYTNHRRNYDYWNNAAVWKLTSSSRGALYSIAGSANSSFSVTNYLTVAMVMEDVERPYINVHVYPAARLSVPNRAKLADLVQTQTGLPVVKCTLGDGCV